ncbi:MAG: formate/nitrite transporter family protein [Cardiobacteriaceae bacterium]|nr:formate/nitrite transporter family protein [Cardiobacteriaceae bacterium]
MAGTTLEPKDILEYSANKGVSKATNHFNSLAVLGFLGGAFISTGYLAYIRIVASMPHDLLGLGKLLGAAVFPVGLVCILLGGGELITGNMMALPVAWMKKRISLQQWVRNWLIVTITNVLGAFFVAWFFGHYVGLTEGATLQETTNVALSKVNASFGQAVVSGIGCNWMVCMGLWLCYGADTFSGKILGIWFPVMVFVAIGFQHVVANMFVIPAAIWGGADISWAQFMNNMLSVYLGNVLGGTMMVGGLYFMAYRD